MGLNELILQLSESGSGILARNLTQRFTSIRTYLNQLKVIRVFTDNSQNFGHQASTVNILRRLIQLGAPGPYELVLSGSSQADVVNLVLKIAVLVPQFKPGDTTFTLNGRTVKVIEFYPGTPKLEPADFCINGGFDNLTPGKTIDWKKLNVVNYVQLQPYAWKKGTNIVRIDDFDLPTTINLDEYSPHTRLDRRAFYVQPGITDSDWTSMEAGPLRTEVAVCRFLLDERTAGRIFLTAGYGFGTTTFPVQTAYNMIAGIRQSQVTLPAARRTTVLIALGLTQESYSTLTDYFIGFGPSGTPEFNAFNENVIVPAVSYVGSPDRTPSAAEVQQALAKLNGNPQEVLVVFLNKVPGPLFNFLYESASLPPMFEGQNTTELMLNLGKPYLKLSRDEAETAFGYPTLPLNSLASSATAIGIQQRVFNGIPAAAPNVWQSTLATYPPAQLPPVTDAYLTPAGNALATYFTSLRAFFHDELNDKLLRALDLFVNAIGPGNYAGDQLVRMKSEAVEQVNIVEALYLRLVEQTEGGVLHLLQAIPTGDVYDFFNPITSEKFKITKADPQLSEDKQVCTLTGVSSAFGPVIGEVDVSFEFTDYNDTGKLQTKFKGVFHVRWALPGADWLAISDPEFGFTMSEAAKVPFVGTMSAIVTAGLTSKITMTVPVEPGVFELQAVFIDPKPSITNIFQLVGGVNLQMYLPSQLQLLTDIEVRTFTTRYNYVASTVDMMGASLGTPADKTWDLVPAVVVSSLAMNVAVIAPGDRLRRKTSFDITGEFGIGEIGPEQATGFITAYAPQLRVMGGLRDDSKPLKLAAVVKAYLGQEFVDVLPQMIREAAISRLLFGVDQPAGRYSFGMTVDTVWDIPSQANRIFTVTQLSFDIAATSRAIDTSKQGNTVVVIGGPNAQAQGPSQTEITGSFGGNVTLFSGAPPDAQLQLTVTAKYLGTKQGWTFSGRQTGSALKIGLLLTYYLGYPEPPPEYNYEIEGLGLTTSTADGAWVFTARAKNWTVPFISGVTFDANVIAGYNPPPKQPQLPAFLRSTAAVAFASGGGCNGTGYFGRVETIWRWNNIELAVWYDYCGTTQSFGITFQFLEALVQQRGVAKEWIGIIRFKKGTTLGSIIEQMVTWLTGSAFGLEAPWSVLNSITLNNLSLEYNFTRNTVSFNIDIGPIDLGLARIDSISCVYENDTSDPTKKRGVFVTLKGSFLWNSGPNANGDTKTLGPWDTSKPGTAPAPPGNGNRYLDLRLLALGQHVTATCLSSAKNVQGAIACLATLPDTKPGETPKIEFDPESAWLIGTEFGLLKFGDDPPKPPAALIRRPETALVAPPAPATGYLVTLQIVFNDPTLYALRIALAGPAAKIFKGLDFQIMYRQVSDNVGVYQAEITLPDFMRYLSIGAYSLTLPVFGISVFTNGDFQVDVGFPWNEDFSRSFTIEGIVYPGIPLLGSAGFYFGKLSSATTNKVPAATNGTFNPVIVFGFGLQVGVGKSIRYGILSAGFSLTVFGIIEGVIAKWNPYQLTDGGTSDESQIQGAYYFWLRGTVGIIGKIFGTVDFAIIKADVNIEVKLMLQLTYESYVSIAITVVAQVSVSVSVKIDLGLFSISISFSFSLRLKETFTIENSGTPPWVVAGAKPAALLRAPADQRLRAVTQRGLRASRQAGAEAETEGVDWSRLAETTPRIPLSGMFAPALALAHDEWDTTANPAMQTPVYVAMMMVDAPAPPSVDANLTATGSGADTISFDKLAKMVLRWAVAAKQSDSVTWEQVDAMVVSALTLQTLIDVDLKSSDANPTPIPPSAASDFMRREFLLTVALPPPSGQSPNTTFFPMPPDLTLEVDAWKDTPAYSYRFGAYNALDQTALAGLRRYFDELAVKVQQEQGTLPTAARAAVEPSPLSMSDWILSDYFLLLMRQMVQSARDALRQFKYPLDESGYPTSPNGIVTWINTTGQLSGITAYTLFDLFAANQTVPVTTGKTVTVGVQGAAAAGMLSFDAFAEGSDRNAGAYTSSELALTNSAATTILQPGKVVTYVVRATPDTPEETKTHTIADGDSLVSIARVFAVSIGDLLINSDVLGIEALRNGAALTIPYVTYGAFANDTFDSISKLAIYANGFTASALARLNAGRPILATAVEVVYTSTGDKYTTVANDTLSSVAAGLNVTLEQLLTGSDILTNPRVIAPVAVIQLPRFNVTMAAGESLQTIAERFAISIDVLALTPENGAQDGFFAATRIDVPHLVQFQVGELLKEIQRTQAISQLSGMTASYYLHGLRLPTQQQNGDVLITPKVAAGIWVKDVGGKLTLPGFAGLYALTGQEIKAPVIPDAAGEPSFVMKLSRKSGPEWIAFSGATDDRLIVSVAYDSTDARRIRKVSAFVTGGATTIPLSTLGAGEMVQSALSTFPFASSLLWQSAAAVQLPYGDAESGGVPSLRIWRMPDAMVNLPRTADLKSERGIGKLPRFAMRVARYDEASGTTVDTDVTSYGWSTTIEFTVKRVPEVTTSAANKTTYELVGATGNSIQLLERIIEQVGNNDASFDQIILGYAPDQSGAATEGVQTDAPANVTLGIAQVNLSTITRPPDALPTFALAVLETGLGLLNAKSEFIQLLWTASITRAGGFYLYYYDSGEKRGLPDRVFNDRGEAALTLVITWSRPGTEFTQNRVTNFMNSVTVGETVEISNSILFAEADPPANFTLPSADLGSLESISFDYYCDIGGLAEANAGRTLANGKTIVVDEGVYQPAPGPGITIAQLESRFGTNRAALETANPRYGGNFPDPLVFPAAIYLPRLELKAGTSPSSTTFSDIRAYYGQGIASLAADPDNRMQSPIFASGQSIEIPGGPRVRSSNVPPGTMALAALRNVPPQVPLEPDTAGYAESFVLNSFSLLNYRLAPNLYFSGSNLGLPAGPQSKPATETNDKMVVPAPVEEVTTWDYRQSVPYPRFAITNPQSFAADLPSAADNPYIGVGYLLQVSFNWQDYYGNTLVTALTSPAPGAQPPYDQPPMLTGYSDALIGLSQWPSVASSYQVDAPSGTPLLQTLLTFDASRYEGLMSARMPNATTVVASFTQALDQASAEVVANYSIAGATIVSASLTSANTVTLTIEAAGSEELVLTASNVQNASKEMTFSGQATFAGDVPISSSLNQNAKTALRTYNQLFHQLNDPNGIGWSVESTMLRQAIPLTEAQVLSIEQWLFEGVTPGGTSIYRFIADRAAWNTAVPAPAGSLTLDHAIELANLNAEQIYLLTVSFILRRTGGAVLGDLETQPGITRVATEVSPRLSKVSAAQDDKTIGLTEFATKFQNALSVPGTMRLKIATGVDRRSVTTARNGSVLWVVRLGLQSDAGEPISYAVDNTADPVIFAPAPISNQLQSHTVPIRAYTTGEGLSPKGVEVDFAGIDMDTWGRLLFGSVDGVLTPEFTSSTQIVGKFRSTDYLAQLLAEKKKLAGIAKDWMIPAFEDEAGADATRVREAYYQQMLTALSSAYTTRAAVEYSAKVNATIHEPGFPLTPRLFGPITFASPRIISASAGEQTPSLVIVAYSAAMASSAGDLANYTISDGIGIATAELSPDGLFATLTLNSPVTLGRSTVTVSASLTDRRGRAIHPPLRVVIHRAGDVRDAASEITFSSPKLDLTVSPATPLPFLVNAPENVRGGGGEIVATLDLDLVYSGTDIEHQISRPEGVEGYVASTWLSFVVRDDDSPLEQSLRTASVPMPLRSFPTAPSMNAQTPDVDPNAGDLQNLTKWAYEFTYSLPVHYPQDVVKCQVEFNINTIAAAMASFVDAFGPIAQFITVFPSVQSDLVTYLAAVSATTDPNSEEGKTIVRNAGVALETIITMLQNITAAATAAGGLVMAAKAPNRGGDPSLTWPFDIQECTLDATGDPMDGALLVSMLVRQKTTGVGMPWVQVGDASYHAVRYHGKDCRGAACDDDQRFCFVYERNDAPGTYLTAAEGQLIPDRIVVLPDLDLFQRQNAQATAKIERNAELVPGRRSAPPFIYTTSDVTFANPLQPTVDSTKTYDLASAGSAAPVKRSLLDQLRNLFSVLLQYNDQPTLTMQVEITYDYVLNATVPPVPLPILMQPPIAVKVKDGGGSEPALDTVLTQWSEATRNWFQTMLPLGTGGRLHFSLAIMTNLVDPPMPLLWTRALQLGLDWIEPKLPTR